MKPYYFLFLTLLLFSCKKKDQNIIDQHSAEITDYFSAFTRGMIQEDQQIVFQFNDNIKVNEASITDAIKISPSQKFNISVDNNLLTIRPLDQWKRGTDYDFRIDLAKAIIGGKNQIVSSKVKVHNQFLSVERKGLVIDKKGNKFIELAIQTALPEKVESLKSIFINTPADNISISEMESNRYNALIPYQSNSTIDWNGKALQCNESGKIHSWRVSKDKLNIVSTYFDKEKREFTAYFSQLLDEKQDATGLITSGNKPLEYKISLNEIKVFLNSTTDESQNIQLKKGIRSITGNKLTKNHSSQVVLSAIKPQLKWLSEGTYIPNSGKFNIPFKAIGLKEVKVIVSSIPNERAAQFSAWNDITSQDHYELLRYGEFNYEKIIQLDPNNMLNLEVWNEFGLDLTDEFERKPGNIYRVNLSFNPSHTILSCNDSELANFDKKTLTKDWFNDKNRYYNYYSYYRYQDRNNPCKPSFYLDQYELSKNIHCTNVFPIIKQGDNSVTIGVKELQNNVLATNAEVTLLNLQGQVIQSSKTSNGGIVTFENLDIQPHAIKLDYKGENSYFSMSPETVNPITEFDVNGGAQDIDTRMFVYSERDIWRPGDSIFVNVMLNRSAHDYPDGLPIKIDFYNAKNVLQDVQVQNIQSNKNLYTFTLKTQVDDPTGYWRANINLGPNQKTHSLRVETIRPNVVDVLFAFNEEENDWIYSQKMSGSINVEYLAGYAVKNGQLKSTANITPLTFPFENHPNYRFAPYNTKSSKNVKLFEVKTNDQGAANIASSLNFKKYKAPSKVIYDTQVNLPAGGSNSESNQCIISPFSSYIGVENKKGNGWKGSFNYGETPTIDLIHVDQKGELIQGSSKAKVILYKARKDWWYDRYRLSRNHNVHSSSSYIEKEVKTIYFNNGKASFKYEGNHGSGLFLLRVVDGTSGHASELRFHSINTQNYEIDRNPEFVQLDLEKDTYKIDEQMRVKLPNIQDSKAFVSIERGNTILDAFWMDLDNPDLELKVKDEWYPNFYLNVSIVQNYGQENNDRPLRMYTIEQIKVQERSEILEPVIKVQDKVRPNETFEIQISEKNGQPMEYTLAVVDKGLQNITGYKLPDPIGHFSRPYSLMIKTWDIFHELIYFMNPSFAGVFSIGGDGLMNKLDESADFNRFEPVVYHLGPFQLSKKSSRVHKIDLSNYIGQLNVAVVAVNNKTFGSKEKNIKASSPLMIQSQMPRALNVSDQVELPITMFKDEASIQSSNVNVTFDKAAILSEKAQMNIDLANTDQATNTFSFTVGEKPGKTNIRLDANANSFKAYEETSIFINYPNGYEEKVTYEELPSMQELTIDVDAFGYETTKHCNIGVSGIIMPAFTKYYQSLIRYPHGCLEQTTSKAFGMLFIEDLVKLSPKERLSRADFMDAALTKLYAHQKADGSFKYWSSGYYHEWADLYAGHLLLEAKEKGLNINQNALNNWLRFTENKANRWRVKEVNNRTLRQEEMLQAYRLFLLAKANKPAKSAMNRFKNRNIEGQFVQTLLGGAYVFAGMEKIGNDLVFRGIQNIPSGYNYYTFGSKARNQAIALMILSQIERTEKIDRFYQNWVLEMNNKNYLSTQEKGFAMMASYYYLKDKNEKLNAKKEIEVSSKKYNEQFVLENNESKNYFFEPMDLTDKLQIKNKGEGKVYIVKTERAISKDLYPEAKANNIQMNVSYVDQSNNRINLDNIKQGEEMIVTVKVKNTDISNFKSMALSLRMPSGWELINPRVLKTAELSQSPFIHQDYRDDKVFTYFELNTKAEKIFKFRVKANLKGNYYLPAVRCEDMYLTNVVVSTKPSRVLIQ